MFEPRTTPVTMKLAYGITKESTTAQIKTGPDTGRMIRKNIWVLDVLLSPVVLCREIGTALKKFP